MIDAAAEREHLLLQIEAQVDPEYQAGVSMAVPTGLNVYGVRVPQLRAIARDWQRAHKGIALGDLVAVADALWDGASREERVLAMVLFQRYQRSIPALDWAHFDRWRRGLDNWEVTDQMGVRVLGPWVLADPDARIGHLWDLVADEDVWSRRLALAATVWLNRGHDGVIFPDLTLALVDQVKGERDPMITKAVSWALREMVKQHPDRVAVYLEANRRLLAPHAVREVDTKLRTGLKSGKTTR